jgi:hypothetical protein
MAFLLARSRPSSCAVHVRAGTCFIMTRSLRQKRKACHLHLLFKFELMALDGLVVEKLANTYQVPGFRAYKDGPLVDWNEVDKGESEFRRVVKFLSAAD